MRVVATIYPNGAHRPALDGVFHVNGGHSFFLRPTSSGPFVCAVIVTLRECRQMLFTDVIGTSWTCPLFFQRVIRLQLACRVSV